MNSRVPDSSGLPLRAMVMVLLFLGVIFLLLGLRALGSSGNADDYSAPAVSSASTSTSAAPPSSSAKPPAAQAEVRVYNISSKDLAAAKTADMLKQAGFNVTETGNFVTSDVTATTVYYTDADGERATAEAVGQKLGAPVERRISALEGKPAGVIVLVTG